MSEIELKFLLDELTSSDLWARVKASKLASGGPRTRTLRSIYLDTPEHALKKAGIALRLRRDGRRWIQTVKTKAELHGGLSQVGEVENPAPGGRLCRRSHSGRSGPRRGPSPREWRAASARLRNRDQAFRQRVVARRTAPGRSWRSTSAKSAPMGAPPNCAKSRSSSSRAIPADCSTSRTCCFPKGA